MRSDKFFSKKTSPLITAVSLIVVAALVVAAGSFAGRLPARDQEEFFSPNEPLYDGIIEIWLTETFVPGKGSHLRWLINSAARFEKKYKGTLINIKEVAPDIARQLIAEGADLPDAIICSGGVLSGAEYLRELNSEAAKGVLPAFSQAVSLDGKLYGLPVSAGAYTILYNSRRIESAGIEGPVTAQSLGLLHLDSLPGKKRGVSYAIGCAQASYQAYSAALMSMINISEVDITAFPPDILTVDAKFAWADFVLEEKSAAYVCTQKEVFRIRQLEAGGNAFPWTAHKAPCEYTDQLLSLHFFGSVTDKNSAEKNAAMMLFAEILLSEERQKALADIGAFSVLDGFELIYPEESAVHFMELGLKSPNLKVPGMLLWSESMAQISEAEKNKNDAAQRLAAVNTSLENLGILE